MKQTSSKHSQMLFLFPRNANFPPTRGDAHRVYSIAKLSVESDIGASVFYLGDGKPFSLSRVQFFPVSGKITADRSIARTLTFLGLARDFLRFTALVVKFARKGRSENTILYGHTPVGGLAASIVKAFTGMSFVYDPHDWHYDSWAVYHRGLDAVKRSCAITSYRVLGFVLPRMSNAVVCVSDSMMRSIKGVDKKILIPNIVEDLPKMPQADEAQKGLIVFVGHLAGYQGLFNLIRAFQFVKRRLEGTSLVIVGDGEDSQGAKGLVEHLGLTNVVFTGAVSHDQAYEYTRKASVCVAPFLPLPFVKTSCPIKLLEYVAMHKKIVVTDIPEFRDMLKGYDNAWFATATPESLAMSIVTSLQTGSSVSGLESRIALLPSAYSLRKEFRSLYAIA